jgi:hypothetical protein
MGTIRNIFACLVHESQDCVIDLVRNLRALDPSSLILLYNGGRDPNLLIDHFPFERHGAVLHPSPRPAEWGHLHNFALDCMQWACDNQPFDTLTIVDSDQLAIRSDYSDYLGAHLKTMPSVGVLGSSSVTHLPGTRIGPAAAALEEIDLWRPLLRMFPDGEQKFVHWCFWPSTVFTADAAGDLIKLFATNGQLQDIMRQTRIWASEEVILPTLVALLGYQIAANPCSYDYVQYRVAFTVRQIEAALGRHDVFWVHPVPRRYEDPLRRQIRERWNHYELAQLNSPVVEAPTEKAGVPRLLLTMPVLEHMRGIEGWLEDAEADLLLAAVTRAIATVQKGAVVEIGSYCGRSTVVLGAALSAFENPNGVRIYAIDPHDGIVGAVDQGVQRVAPTRERFLNNISNAGITHLVEPITRRSFEVEWDKPICFLFIDGLHDYVNVARDFYHFESWIAPGGFVAFHDYADYYPGVKTFVDELLARGAYEKVHQELSMIVVRGTSGTPADALPSGTVRAVDGHEGSHDEVFGAQSSAAAVLISGAPLVSCIMPTANRRMFAPQAIRYFQRQEYTNRELIILDDGTQELADLIPSDSRIRYVRMERKSTMGAKHNLACELAQGEIIVHWDDDDWMADWRLTYQIEAVRAHPSNTLCGLTRLYFYDPAADSAWQYVYPANERRWVSGGTFCYRREFWERHRFPDMNEGADTVFVWGLEDAEVVAHARHDFYVGVVHAANTSPKRTHDPAWHPVPVQKIYGMLEADWSFYQNLLGRA